VYLQTYDGDGTAAELAGFLLDLPPPIKALKEGTQNANPYQ